MRWNLWKKMLDLPQWIQLVWKTFCQRFAQTICTKKEYTLHLKWVSLCTKMLQSRKSILNPNARKDTIKSQERTNKDAVIPLEDTQKNFTNSIPWRDTYSTISRALPTHGGQGYANFSLPPTERWAGRTFQPNTQGNVEERDERRKEGLGSHATLNTVRISQSCSSHNGLQHFWIIILSRSPGTFGHVARGMGPRAWERCQYPQVYNGSEKQHREETYFL